ncbi:MAG: hypothetical protein KDN22_33315 [Verrucomicrobiae bacterium]|nr:hypothetical protein [Verrucomicrobiae bacterium]
MSERDPLGRESYNELMNEWADTRNAMLRMQGGILHPPAYLSPVARLFGYLWRIVVVVIVVIVGAFFFIQSHIKSADFSDMVGSRIGRMLRASEVEISPLRWKRSMASSKQVTLKSSDTSFFLTELKAEGFRFKLPFGSLMKDEWKVEDIFIGDLTADVRPGSGGEGASIMDDLSGKWGIDPGKIEFESVDIANANLTWGLVSTARGGLTNARIEVVKEDGVWEMHVTKGQLSQNYLRNLNVTNLKIRFLENSLIFSEGEFTMGENGKGTLEGNIKVGEYPEFDIKVNLDGCDMADVLPKYTGAEMTRMTPEEQSAAMAIDTLRDMLPGRVTGSIVLTGSSNSAAGIKTLGRLGFNEATEQTVRILSIPLFDDLGGETGNSHLRRPLITGGTLAFVTSEGVCTISGMDLQLGQSARLMGEFSFGIEKQLKKPSTNNQPPVPGVPILEEAPEVPIPKFDGTVQFGVTPASVSKVPAKTLAEFFPVSRDDMIWMDLPLKGNLKEVTADTGSRLLKSVRLAEKEKIE